MAPRPPHLIRLDPPAPGSRRRRRLWPGPRTAKQRRSGAAAAAVPAQVARLPHAPADPTPKPPEAGRLREWRDTPLDGAGAGAVTFGPVPSDRRWIVTSITVHLAPDPLTHPTAEAVTYFGQYPVARQPRNLGPVTTSGALDTATQEPPIVLEPGWALDVVWAGADTGGQTATAAIDGRVVPL